LKIPPVKLTVLLLGLLTIDRSGVLIVPLKCLRGVERKTTLIKSAELLGLGGRSRCFFCGANLHRKKFSDIFLNRYKRSKETLIEFFKSYTIRGKKRQRQENFHKNTSFFLLTRYFYPQHLLFGRGGYQAIASIALCALLFCLRPVQSNLLHILYRPT